MTAPNASIRELIQRNVESAIAGIVAAESGPSEYNYTVRKHEREHDTPFDGPYPAVFIYDGGDTMQAEYDYALRWQMTLNIGCYLKSTKTTPGAMATERNALIADVQRAVMQDRQRGGLAVDTALSGVPETWKADNLLGALVVVTIDYMVKPNDPTVQP